jgi:MoaA/NifB/PqqE/SkfB family radical SAM enzyme
VTVYPDHRSLYRLPWSLPDNPIAWLESTAVCNLYCEGCYRENVKDSHKSLARIEHELDVFDRFRNFDGVSIAGGDPLTHPEIVAIVARIAQRGWKPILNTNGLALTPELLRELAAAGLVGFTFHVDSMQRRPGWIGKDEIALNELRQELADMVYEVGDISVAFNSTVYGETLPHAPEMLAWARRNVDRVHVMVFICYRQAAAARQADLDFYVGRRRVQMEDLVYSRPTDGQRLDLSSRDVVAEMRTRFPDFAPCAYLNGTERADTLKWLLTTYMTDGREVMGYLGPRFMEALQGLHHLRKGRWLAYAPPSQLRRGRTALVLGGLLDPAMRRALGAWTRRPWRWHRSLRMQSVMIIQPVDILADGGMNMCDACPDITVDRDELVWSCRLEERLKYGGFVRGVVKESKEAEVEVGAEVGAGRSAD